MAGRVSIHLCRCFGTIPEDVYDGDETKDEKGWDSVQGLLDVCDKLPSYKAGSGFLGFEDNIDVQSG